MTNILLFRWRRNEGDYDDASIASDIFGEDMISLSWSASFHSQHDLGNQNTDDDVITDIRPDVDADIRQSVSEVEIEDEAEQRVPEKKERKRRSVG